MRPRRLLVALTGAVTAGLVGVRAARAAAPPVRPSGTGGTAPAPDGPRPTAGPRAWAELLRVSALFTVPGDALAGAAALGRAPGRGTALAVGASLCLYEAGMALNDWADRDEDAVDRPHRPIPSGRISPGAALAAAGALTAAGLALASRAGRPALAVASGLAATVWAYDLRLKHTPAGPAAMAAARSLDLLLGAVATGERTPGGPSARAGRGSANPGGRGSAGSASGSASGGWTRAPGRGSAVPAALLLGAPHLGRHLRLPPRGSGRLHHRSPPGPRHDRGTRGRHPARAAGARPAGPEHVGVRGPSRSRPSPVPTSVPRGPR
ncbi:hypothetical protein GCM10020227_21670 [Streptomyces flavovirens]